MDVNSMTQRPYKENDLFRGEPSAWHMNACVGHNGGPYDYHAYGDGYLRAAIAIVPSAENYQNPVDILIYPIAFCFRHAIELYLKHFCEMLPRIWDEEQLPKLTHKLIDNWGVVKSYLEREDDFIRGNNSIQQFEKILHDFVQIDPTGETFRFPVNRKGGMHLEDSSVINVLVLRNAMLEAHNILEIWHRMASAWLDYKHETAGL